MTFAKKTPNPHTNSMNCFYSPNQPAIGLCKSCLRGLSSEYATDVGDGLACKGICETRARKINLMVDSNSKVMAVANTQVQKNASFSIVAGVLFGAMGFFMGLPSGQPMALLFCGLGLLFIFRGISGYTRSSKYPSSEADGEQGADGNPH